MCLGTVCDENSNKPVDVGERDMWEVPLDYGYTRDMVDEGNIRLPCFFCALGLSKAEEAVFDRRNKKLGG